MIQARKFPKSFIFGVADADLQVIGEKNTLLEERSLPTMWTHFAKTSGKCHKNDTPLEGIDRYHLWKQDIEIMKAMGVHHYRTSLSMSRILNQDGTVNSKAVAWYKNYFQSLLREEISIYATLYHWELPLLLHEIGGWTNKKSIDFFLRHVDIVAEYLGEYIKEIFILNEPWCAAMLSYHLGSHAPGENNLSHALQSAHNLLLAQGAAYEVIKKRLPNTLIGTVVNSQPTYANTLSNNDILAAHYSDGYFNRWFMDPVFIGKYPEHMVELYGKKMPNIKEGDMDLIKIGSKLDMFAINYYCGDNVAYDKSQDRKYKTIIKPGSKTNDLGWPIFLPPTYEEGLYDMLQQVYYSYRSYGLKKMYVTENGMALSSNWNGKDVVIDDSRRIEYYQGHIAQIHKALTRGIPIAGYFAWTLMDNYEWAEGYKEASRFGLIYVDRGTMKRIWKKSAHWYKKLIKDGTIPLIFKS